MIDVIAKARGTCPACGVDINTGIIPDEKPRAAAKKQLTNADIFFRFLVFVLGSSVLLGIFGPHILK